MSFKKNSFVMQFVIPVTFTIITILFLFLISGCVLIREMTPKKPSPSVLPDDIIPVLGENQELIPVTIDRFFVSGHPEPHTPGNVTPTANLSDFLMDVYGTVDLNRSAVIRFSKEDDVSADTIIVLVPGIFSGAGTVSNLSEGIVRRLSSTELWIWERRGNLLEDRRLVLKALKEKNNRILLDALKPDSFELKPGSFYQPSTEDISFVGYWGLNVHLDDLYYVLMEAKKRAPRVILAGYSLGVLYVTNFLANRFELDGKQFAGHSLVDDVILFDGPPMLDGYVGNEHVYQQGVTMIPYNQLEGKAKLESGDYYPTNGSVTRDMSFFFMTELRSALAYLSPDELSPVPYKVGSKSIPITNLARFMVQFDDNYNMFKLFTATLGRAEAQHRGTFGYDSKVSITGLSDGYDRIEWITGNHEGIMEYNEPFDYLSANLHPYFNMPEWYQPTRILLDLGSIHHNDTSSGWQRKYFKVVENHNVDTRFLCMGLSRGLSSQVGIYGEYLNTTDFNGAIVVMVDNITHLDGDTVHDRTGRVVLADVVAHWTRGEEILFDRERYLGNGYYEF